MPQTVQLTSAKTRTDVGLIHIILLITILTGATLLRIHALGKTSYWFDEICSVLYARGQTAAIFMPPEGYYENAPALASKPGTRPWRDVWFGFDTTPPLYPTLLRLWWHVFGEGDLAGRALSVTLSVLTIAALFDLGRLILNPTLALWACALCAASPPMVRYAQEARSYAMLCLLGVLICDIAIRIARSGGSAAKYVSLWILCGAALLTHNFTAGGMMGIAVFGIIRLRGHARLATVCCVLSAFVVEFWELPVVLHHALNLQQGLDWQIEPRDGLFLKTLLRIVWMPIVYLILPPDDASIAYLPMSIIFIFPLFMNKRHSALLLAALWPIGLIGLVAASDLWLRHGALLYVRYTLAAAPMLFICFVAIADMGGRWIRHGLPALAVAGAILAMPQIFSAEQWIKPESRELAKDVRDHVSAGDVLLIVSRPDMRMDGAGPHYLAIDFYAGPLPCAVAILESPADENLRRSIWSHERVWLVKCWDISASANQVDPASYIGPCRLTPTGDVHLFAGRLFLAEHDE